MPISKRIILLITTCLLFFSGSVVIYAQTDKSSLERIEKHVREKEREKNSVNAELRAIEKEIQSINDMMSRNKAIMAVTEKRISDINKRIEAKKEEIIFLQERILARKDIMKQRLVALQHDHKLSIFIEVLAGAESFSDFIDRASALSTLFDADKELLQSQERDIKKLEEEKKEIDKQQEMLLKEQNRLKQIQQNLAKNLESKEKVLENVRQKLEKINSELSGAQREKAAIEAKLNATRDMAAREREAANNGSQSSPDTQTPGGDIKGTEMYVVATAYSHEENGAYTRLGYNIRENPHMKLIAVDPKVIPLGSKVWVEGYGVAIAGDTGGAIKGYKIDVLMPTRADALKWGRKTVKIIVLD